MTAKVYTIASGKGGVGKTTTTINLGTALAGLGKRTIVLDADIGMANLGLTLGLEKSEVTLHEVLAGKANVKDAIYDGPNGLKVLPSGISLQGFQNADPEKMVEVMGSLVENYDFMLIDAPAGISKDGVIPLAIADEVILVVNPEITSVADAMKTKVLTEMIDSNVLGVVINRGGTTTTELSNEKVAKLLDCNILEVVPDDVNIRNALAFRMPLVVKYPESPASIAFKRLAASLAGMEMPDEDEEVVDKDGFVNRLSLALFGSKVPDETEEVVVKKGFLDRLALALFGGV
ncbi:MAG: cell division ATPase MinD [Methanosarcinaceae archaeon]|nr:cell division ATPase MinD [Methanosarcinaceae archaeon]